MKGVELFMGVIVPFANFLLFVYLFKRFFGASIAAYFAQLRSDFLKSSEVADSELKSAKEALRLAEKTYASLEKKLQDIDDEAKDRSEQEASSIVTAAKDAAERMVRDAKRSSEAADREAMERAKRDFDEKLRLAVKDIVRERYGDDDDRALVQRSLAHFDQGIA